MAGERSTEIYVPDEPELTNKHRASIRPFIEKAIMAIITGVLGVGLVQWISTQAETRKANNELRIQILNKLVDLTDRNVAGTAENISKIKALTALIEDNSEAFGSLNISTYKEINAELAEENLKNVSAVVADFNLQVSGLTSKLESAQSEAEKAALQQQLAQAQASRDLAEKSRINAQEVLAKVGSDLQQKDVQIQSLNEQLLVKDAEILGLQAALPENVMFQLVTTDTPDNMLLAVFTNKELVDQDGVGELVQLAGNENESILLGATVEGESNVTRNTSSDKYLEWTYLYLVNYSQNAWAGSFKVIVDGDAKLCLDVAEREQLARDTRKFSRETLMAACD
jgi:hypothetical protein